MACDGFAIVGQLSEPFGTPSASSSEGRLIRREYEPYWMFDPTRETRTKKVPVEVAVQLMSEEGSPDARLSFEVMTLPPALTS